MDFEKILDEIKKYRYMGVSIMKNIKFSKEEIRALKVMLDTNTCRSGCAFSEMQNSKKDCDDCELTKLKISISKKIDYTQ